MKLSTVAKGALFIWLILMSSSSVAESGTTQSNLNGEEVSSSSVAESGTTQSNLNGEEVSSSSVAESGTTQSNLNGEEVSSSSVAESGTTQSNLNGEEVAESGATQSNGEEGASYPSAQRLYFNDAQEHICKKLRKNRPLGWIKCWRFGADNFRKFDNSSQWCDLFARCFIDNETAHWASPYLAKFCQLPQSQKAAATNDTLLPAMDIFHVHPCPAFRETKFAVSVSLKGSGDSNEAPRDAGEQHPPSQDPTNDDCSSLCNIRFEQKNAAQRAVSVVNTTIQELRNISIEDKDDIIFTMDAVEDFFIRFAKENLNETSPNFKYNSSQFDFRVQRVFMPQRNVREFLLNGTKGDYMNIPSRNFQNGSVVLGVIYNNIHELFLSDHSANISKPNQTRWLNTIIMSAVIHPSREVLLENVTLVFESIKAAGKNRECVFWNSSEENPEGWSGKGCLTRIINSSLTECLCNHLTHFAVLMDYADSAQNRGPTLPSKKDDKILTIPKKDDKILTILTLVGMSLSLTGVVSTIISYLLLTDRDTPLSHIRVSLATAIGAGHVIFFAGIDATGNKGGCIAVAALLQYFLMAGLCWMLVEGIYLYLFVVKVYNIVDKMRVYQAISWGLPAVIVASSLGIAAGKDGIQSFVNDKCCWMSYANNLIWIFIAFVGLIELLNTFILIRVIKEMMTMQHAKENQSEQIRLGIKAFVVLVPLLGVTWLFGFLLQLHLAFFYIFVILNSTQGFFIFVFHCLRNNEIRERFKRRFRRMMPQSENPTTRTGESCDVASSSCRNDF